MSGTLTRLIGLPKRSVTTPLSRDCLSCGRLLPIGGLLRGSKQSVLGQPPQAFVCPSCTTAQRYRARSTTVWFFGLMLGVAWLGLGPVSTWLETRFPQFLVLDRQAYGLGVAGFMIIALFFFLPAGLLVRFLTLHLAELEHVP